MFPNHLTIAKVEESSPLRPNSHGTDADGAADRSVRPGNAIRSTVAGLINKEMTSIARP